MAEGWISQGLGHGAAPGRVSEQNADQTSKGNARIDVGTGDPGVEGLMSPP